MHQELKEEKNDMGNSAMEFNSQPMHRGLKTGNETYEGIYPD